MSAPNIVVAPAPGVGYLFRAFCTIRRVLSRRLLLRLSGVPCVQIEGCVIAVRARPIEVMRDLLPALLNCGQAFNQWRFDEELYDNFITVLSLGLNIPRNKVERFRVPLWNFSEVIGLIAEVNGVPVMEAGRADLGKLLETMLSTGMPSSPASSAAPDGRGSTSSDA